jgi:hypothetical protein
MIGFATHLAARVNHRMEVWLVTHTDMRRSARIRAVYDFVAEALSNDRKVLQGKGA